MKVPLSWLNDYVNLNGISPETIAKELTFRSAEVERIEKTGGEIPGVLIGRILDFHKHPNADKLNLVTVDLGTKTQEVVCGAANIKKNALIAFATLGTSLPNGMQIKKATIRGVDSEGMICSKQELGLAETSEGIWLLEDESLSLGDNIGTALGAEDYIFEIAVGANRGDLLSVIGIARELAAIFERRFAIPDVNDFTNAGGNVDITVERFDDCPRYTARIVKGVVVGPSPDWLVRRLEMVGLRSINTIVDVTNYVLYEYGQPLHSFDLAALEGQKIVVRRAKEGEKIIVIDGTDVTLTPDVLIIADAKKPVAIAGVMGGKNTQVTEATKDILIESACFSPIAVRMSGKRVSIKSDSSYRFERGVDEASCVAALNRAVDLIVNIVGSGGVVSSKAKDIHGEPFEKNLIMFDCALVKERLAIDLPRVEISKLFMRLGFNVKTVGQTTLQVEIPAYRRDISLPVDLIEELARMYGYNELPTHIPTIASNIVPSDYYALIDLKTALAAYGLWETYHFSMAEKERYLRAGFDEHEMIDIVHPISKELGILRPNLFIDMLRTLETNARFGAFDGAYFELGNTFVKNGDAFIEKRTVAMILYGMNAEPAWNAAPRAYDFYDLSGIFYDLFVRRSALPNYHVKPETHSFFAPAVSATAYVNETALGVLGEVHPRIMKLFDLKGRAYFASFDIDTFFNAQTTANVYIERSKFPSVYRDLALVCDKNIEFSLVLTAVKTAAPLLKDVRVIDVYEGAQVPEGKRSVAISLVYSDVTKTLTDAEVNEAEATIVKTLKEQFAIALR